MTYLSMCAVFCCLLGEELSLLVIQTLLHNIQYELRRQRGFAFLMQLFVLVGHKMVNIPSAALLAL